MPKVFRPSNIQLDNSIVDWSESKAYGNTAIGQIVDPDGATSKKEITSIPSPFARMDLIKTAFREVVRMAREARNFERLGSDEVKKLLRVGSGNKPTIYHKMVSETLDVAEIFFNYGHLNNKFEIIAWDRSKDLDKNNVLGNTLNRFLESDSRGEDPYNFKHLDRIFMLNYKGPGRPEGLNIIGATSPATMFFSSANYLNFVSEHVALGNNNSAFGNSYTQLFDREYEFQKYLYLFRKLDEDFNHKYPEVDAYMRICMRCMDDEQRDELEHLTQDNTNNYEDITIGQNGEITLKILGRNFQKRKEDHRWESDFEIKSTVYKGEHKPLALPIEAGNTYESYRYTTSLWGSCNKAPYYDKRSIETRTLPNLDEAYPYLTVSDFLVDTIIRVPYEHNSESFVDGGYKLKQNDEPHSFLLPLSEDFFRYFTAEDLEREHSNGKRLFELVSNAGGVKVILRIPVRKGYVEYSRVYYEKNEPDVSEKKNDGGMIETEFGLGIMPLVSFPEGTAAHYRIAFFDRGKMDASIACYEGMSEIDISGVTRVKKDLDSWGCSHEAYAVGENFDRIRFTYDNAMGWIVPKFKRKSSDVKFSFAVDFGTTNTHIEYCTNNNANPMPFSIARNEVQMNKLHKKYLRNDIRLAFEQDFIPDTIGDVSDSFSFPMRTVFAERFGIEYQKDPKALCDGNIPFLYEKNSIDRCNIRTELKWGGVPEALLRMHLETLFILMRNKVVLNNGRLSDTQVVWFYPASMTEGKVIEFKKIWKEGYQKYFGNDAENNVISISESKAPYQHFIKTQNASPNTVTIDIGGGTTDVFVVENNVDKMLLSFRFASNAIFGDGYNSNPSQNGFVVRYKDLFKNSLTINELGELVESLEQIESQQKSTDICNFLFALAGEKVNDNKDLDFLRKLTGDTQLKYVFIIFYGAIFYFIAQSMHARNLSKPRTIAFSGNGSKTIRVVSDELKIVAKFAKLIFDGVYGNSDGFIEVKMEPDPKIATCKGGLENREPQPYEKIDNLKAVFVGNFIQGGVVDLRYGMIDESVKQGILQSNKDFLNFLFKLHRDNKDFLTNTLGADVLILKVVQNYCSSAQGWQKMEDSLTKGLDSKKTIDNVQDDTKLEETLFFYPLIGLLNDLAYIIVTANNNANNTAL